MNVFAVKSLTKEKVDKGKEPIKIKPQFVESTKKYEFTWSFI